MAFADSGKPAAWQPTRARLFWVFSIYFAVQLISRTLLSSSAHLDESEQLMLTQKLSWGYGSQPPLYTWIQAGLFNVFGVSIFSLALFKNLLLFFIYALTYWNARFITRSHVCGIIAAVSLVFFPQIIWESQRDLTHSVLATFFSLAALGLFCRLVEFPQTVLYLAFGACIGLGSLSKYNFILFGLGLLLAGLTLKKTRRAICDWRMLLALIIATLIFLPNGLWMVHHWQATIASDTKFRMESAAPWFGTTAHGVTNLIGAGCSFILPPLLIYGLYFYRAPKHAEEAEIRCDFVRLMARTLAIIFVVLIISIGIFHITNFRGRWFQPILAAIPILAATLLRRRMDLRRVKWFLFFALAVAGAITIALPGRILLGERLKHEEPLHQPYDALAAQLQSALLPSTVIITPDHLLAGNLRLALQPHPAVSIEFANDFAPDAQHLLFVWSDKKSPEPPEVFRAYAEKISGVDWSRAKPISARLKYYRHKEAQIYFVAAERMSKTVETNRPPTTTASAPRQINSQ